MATKIEYYSQMANATALEITRTPEQWVSFLNTASRIYKYPYNEQILIHAQRPEATACASYEIWNKHMGRYIIRGSQGIALLDSSGDSMKIKYVFDIADTRTTDRSRNPNLWEIHEEHEAAVRTALTTAYATGGITLADQLDVTASFLVDDYWYAHKEEISHNIANSMLQDYDEDTIRMGFCELATISTSYILKKRCGMDPKFDPLDFMTLPDFDTPEAVYSLGCAVSSTSEQILRQIEVTVKSYEKMKSSERSNTHEQSELRPERRLSDSRSQTEGHVPGAPGQVRENAESLSAGEQAHSLEQHDSERDTVPAPERNPADSREPVGRDDAETSAGRRSNGGAEAERRHEMDSPDEHAESTGRGSNPAGADLQLNDSSGEKSTLFPIQETMGSQVSFFPSETEQLEYLTQAEDAVIAPSVFLLPQEVTDSFLIHGSNTDRHRMAIVSEFSKGRTQEELANFLCALYHGGNGFEVNGRDYSAWYAYDGIHIASGHSARYAKTAQVVSWKQASDRVQDLLADGKFATNVELTESPTYERKVLSEKLWYLASDLSESGIKQNLLSTIRDLHGGFPAETALLSGFLQDTVSIRAISQELETFLEAYETDRSVLRFHYHNPQLLDKSVKELVMERQSFHSELTAIQALPAFITEDELDASFVRGSGMAGGKDRIYQFFTSDHSLKEQADFLKKEYGTGGRSHALSDSSGSEESHDSKGIVLKKQGCEAITLGWERTARRISDMIQQNRYLSQEEMNQMDIVRQEVPEESNLETPDSLEHPSYNLATDLDALAYDLDTYDYNDRVEDREAQVLRIQDQIEKGHVSEINQWLTEILAGPDADLAARAYDLMDRISQIVSEPKISYTAIPNEYSHNALDRMNIMELLPDGTMGESLGLGQEAKCIQYTRALNNGVITPEAVKQELTAERQKWHCYVIPDIATWNPVIAGDRVRTPIEYFDSYEEAKNRFLELRNKSYLMEDLVNPESGEPVARLTFGIQREDPPGAADLIHVRNDINYLVDDFTRMSSLHTSQEAMDILQNLHNDLGFDRIRVYEKDEEGIYMPPKDLAFAAWENPYFTPQEEEVLYQLDDSHNLHIQVSNQGYDYTIYDRESHETLDGGILTSPDLSIPSAAREICRLQNFPYGAMETLDLSWLDIPQKSQTELRVLDAMKQAGFTQVISDSGIHFADASGYPLTFDSWKAAYEWLDTAEFRNTPEIRTAVQAFLHTDAEYAQEHLIPGETEFVWDDRRFRVESVDLANDSVELRDLTFQEAAGYPIFREEHIAPVRRHLESIVPQLDDRPVEVSVTETVSENYHIIDPHLGEGGPKAKFTDNLRAIRLLKALEAEGRQAQPDEQEVLSRYVGWGGLADAFEPDKKSWEKEYSDLKGALTSAEYDSAKASTLNAHYTSPTIIRSVYQAVENMGFQSGNILEPAMGTGNFFGMLPTSLEGSKLYGVELDSISGRIAKQLYPQANITVAGFETTDRKDFYDLVVGNVPFGNYTVNDRAYNKHGFSIHNYFIAKSIDQVRPGGMVAVLTSRYTMDAKNSSARKYMAQRAELLGAIRLPNDAFKANAGAEVVSDILFLQKREQPTIMEPAWVQSAPNEQGHRVNQYFLDHPEMVLGNQTEHNTAHGMDYTVEPFEGISLEQSLQSAVREIHGNYHAVEAHELSDGLEVVESIPADPTVKNYSYTVVNNQLYYRENSIMVKPEVSSAQEKRMKGLVQIRHILSELIDYQVQDYPEAQIQEKQAELNTVYDAFTKEYGIINSKANEKAFSDDSSYYLLSALEFVDEDGNLERKADMFYKRTIRAIHHVERVDTPSDALIASLGEKGRVDLPYMSQLLGGQEIPQITEALQGAIYRDPSLPEDAQWVTADEYLSGNVRQKLQDAELAVAKDSNLAINVQALTEAQPKPLEATEIDVRLGATWIDPEYIQEFMHETFQTPYYRRYKVKIEYSRVTGEWRVGEKGVGWGNDVTATSTYGTTRATAYQILEDSLNLRDVRVNDYIEIGGKKKTVLNQKETTLASQKQTAIAEAFSDWIWKDPVRRNDLVEKYNKLYNSTRPREYDGSHIVFGGINPDIQLRDHQLNAIAHILYGGNTLLAHEVGAGKSFEMIAAAMESKRLGLCEKSLIVVPNHLTLQWANEFLRLYPSANILVTSKKDFEPANRKKFCGRIATGDYDAVIIGHSQFEMIPVSVERQKKTIEDQLQEIEEAIYDQRWSGKTFTVKQLEKAKKSLESKLEKLMANDRKDDVVTFEQLGVDRLFIDESQIFKNLYYHTKMRNVAGLSTSESQRSTDLYMKCRYMDELTGNRGVVFASGTPISNSMSEMYTLMRYLQYDTLQEHGLNHFDNWAATFGETVTAIELAPEGSGYRARTRFSRFFNLPELMCMFKEVADIKTADQLSLPVPEAKFETVVVKPSDHQKELVEGLSERAAEIHAGNVDPSVDNMLKVTSDGKKIGLDQRLMNSLLPDDPGSKVNTCVQKVFEIWQDGQEKRLTQMIFSDMSTPHTTGKGKTNDFNVYDDIKRKLIDRGVPAEEIAFIHDAKTEAQKKELFTKVRKGQVRILLGSTEKMGAGTNCQDKLIALHHLDVPWRPSDMTQRNGRIIRQGNGNPEVQIYQYVTEGTFDSYLYQTLENKQRFISQIMTSKSPMRSCEDMDEAVLSYAEIKALCAGNPLIKEKMDLDIQVANLQTLKASYKSEHFRLEDKLLTFYPREIHSCQELIAGCEKDLELSARTSRDEFSGITIKGILYTEKKEGGQALIDACRHMAKTDTVTIGSYRGFNLELSFNGFTQEYMATLRGASSHTAFLSNDPYGNLTRLDNAIAHIPERIQKANDHMIDLGEQQKAAEAELQKPFIKEDELKAKAARLAELNIQLDMNAKGTKDAPIEEPSHEDNSALSKMPSSLMHDIAILQQKNIRNRIHRKPNMER